MNHIIIVASDRIKSSLYHHAGGEVGHAFFPENGNIHLDDDELWTDTGHGMHLTTMAAHLIGHALGLAHSQESSAIMSTDRIARGRTVGINLHHNDVSAIQRLYGNNENNYYYRNLFIHS